MNRRKVSLLFNSQTMLRGSISQDGASLPQWKTLGWGGVRKAEVVLTVHCPGATTELVRLACSFPSLGTFPTELAPLLLLGLMTQRYLGEVGVLL